MGYNYEQLLSECGRDANKQIPQVAIPVRAPNSAEDVANNPEWFKVLEQEFYQTDSGKQLVQDQIQALQQQRLLFLSYVEQRTGFPSSTLAQYRQQQEVRNIQVPQSADIIPTNPKKKKKTEQSEEE